MVLKLTVGEFQSNCYILKFRESAILIDAGGDGHLIEETLKKEKVEKIKVVLTHTHIDHWQAVPYLIKKFNTQVFLSLKEKELALNPEFNLSAFYGNVKFPDFRDVIWFKDGDEIRTETFTLRVVESPGHTPGSVLFLKDKEIFTGDTLFKGSVGRCDLPGGNEKLLFKSIREKILPLPPQTKVYPGHGPDTTVGEEKRKNPFLSNL